VLIAGTPRFVNGADWTHGIAPEVLDTFAGDLEHDCTATLQRFLSLQVRGDADAREVLRQLRRKLLQRPASDVAALAAGLRILKDSDLRALLPQISQPALILHGTQDTVVPLAAGEFMAREMRDARLTQIAGAAHAPFAHVQQIACSIREFCREQ
jgi:pimeloyl-[acyl-carrier protein] methyl ester esterase